MLGNQHRTPLTPISGAKEWAIGYISHKKTPAREGRREKTQGQRNSPYCPYFTHKPYNNNAICHFFGNSLAKGAGGLDRLGPSRGKKNTAQYETVKGGTMGDIGFEPMTR